MVWGWYLRTRLGRHRSAGDGMGRSRWSPWSAENVMWVVKQRLKRGGLKYRTLWYIFYIMDLKGNLRFRTHIKLVCNTMMRRVSPPPCSVFFVDTQKKEISCIIIIVIPSFPGRKNSLRLWLQHLMEKCANGKTKGQCIGALTTGCVCNCNAKEITILFCKQIGRSPNTNYAKCWMGLREGKMEMAGNSFSSRPIFCVLNSLQAGGRPV